MNAQYLFFPSLPIILFLLNVTVNLRLSLVFNIFNKHFPLQKVMPHLHSVVVKLLDLETSNLNSGPDDLLEIVNWKRKLYWTIINNMLSPFPCRSLCVPC